MLPASLRHGTITETDGFSGSGVGGMGRRATIQFATQNHLNGRNGASTEWQKRYSSGKRLGSRMRESVCTTSNPASCSRLLTSSTVTQLSVGWRYLIPSHSAIESIGCHRRL